MRSQTNRIPLPLYWTLLCNLTVQWTLSQIVEIIKLELTITTLEWSKSALCIWMATMTWKSTSEGNILAMIITLIHFYIHSDSKISKKKFEEISGRRGLRMGLLWASLSWVLQEWILQKKTMNRLLRVSMARDGSLSLNKLKRINSIVIEYPSNRNKPNWDKTSVWLKNIV